MPATAPNTRRDLFRSSIEVLTLSVLADGPQHGYAIRQELNRSLGQTLPVGSLYPLLHRLESEGRIASNDTTHRGRPRKVYRLTPEGQRHLKHAAADWQANLEKLGITMKERNVDFALYRRRLEEYDFDMIAIAGGDFTLPDATSSLTTLVFWLRVMRAQSRRSRTNKSPPVRRSARWRYRTISARSRPRERRKTGV